MLVTGKKTFFITDFRYKGVAERILPKDVELIITAKGLIKSLENLTKRLKIKIVHFEEKNLTYLEYRTLKKHVPSINFKPSQNLVEELRIVKDPKEIRWIAQGQRIAEKVFLEVRSHLKVGKTELEVAREIEALAQKYEAEGSSFASIIGFGPNSANPHHQNTNRKLKKGEVVLIDMGMKYQGYCSDMTRMIFTGKPTSKQKEIYNMVLEAQEKAIQKLHSGIQGAKMDKIARDMITKAGYGHTFGHSLGHGIGLEVHENPTLSSASRNTLPENTIVTVEPGIYLPNLFGVRIEDMLLVKQNRAINLTKIPKRIEACIFTIS